MPSRSGSSQNLIEVHGLVGRRIELAVADAGAGGNALELAGAEDRAVPETVLVFQGTREHVRDDFHVAVSVRAKPFAGSDAVFVDHPQRAKAHLRRIVIIGE